MCILHDSGIPLRAPSQIPLYDAARISVRFEYKRFNDVICYCSLNRQKINFLMEVERRVSMAPMGADCRWKDLVSGSCHAKQGTREVNHKIDNFPSLCRSIYYSACSTLKYSNILIDLDQNCYDFEAINKPLSDECTKTIP
jgi:hypothetical protein